MNKRIVIVANGTLWKGIIREIKKDDLVIGVDGAAYWLLKHGITPHIAIGDFDSVSTYGLTIIQKKIRDVRQQPPHPKYETDMELAIQYAIQQKPSEVYIYGGIGSRIDHTLATIGLLDTFDELDIPAFLRHPNNEVRLLSRGRTILRGRGYTYVSVISYTKEIIVTLKKFKYDVKNQKISKNMSLGISNEFLGSEAEVTVHSGKALVIQSRD